MNEKLNSSKIHPKVFLLQLEIQYRAKVLTTFNLRAFLGSVFGIVGTLENKATANQKLLVDHNSS